MSQNLSVAQQILARAAAAPSAPAVYHGGHVYTYSDLVRAAVVLEQALPGAAADGGVPQIVALVLPRSFDLVSSLLGVWLSGRAAIVVDVLGLPEERVEFILKDCNVQHVVTNDALGSSKVIPMLARVGMCPAVHYVKDGTGEGESASLTGDFIRNAQTRSAVSAATNPAASTLAYVVYTSGSTGRPKGVMVPHIGLMNLADYYRSERAMTAADCVAQTVSPGFDPIHEEMWPALTSGASLRIASEETRMAPQLLAEWLATSGVTICLLPTPVAELVLQCDDIWRAHNAQSSSFRLLICGGDVLKNRKPAHCWFGFDNHYGPSEATILATVYAIESSLEVPPPPPIGKPIPNTTLEIVDRDTLEPVPVGEWGEILLGGLGIALGYLNLPGKTNERFLTRGDERRRLYRTGDIGRIRASDGEVEFGGRVDLQVKIDGERIELGEVETCLANAPSVRECVVAARELGVLGKKQLVAYVVPDADARDGRGTGVCKEHASMTFIEILRKHAAAKLLPKMRPHHFVVLNELPLTSNGKVDRRGLPNPDVKSSATVSQDPPSVSASAPVALPVMSAKEEFCATKICAIVASVLGASPDTVTPTLNVFELGASSLHCATMMLMVRKQMNFPGVGLDALFRSPTPMLLARSLLAATNKDAFTKCADGGLVATARSNGSDTLMSVSDLIGEANTVLEEELGDIRLAAAPKSMALGPDIMLTGATGFLGAYLLRDLLLDQNFPNSNIYCTVRVPASVGNHDPTRQNAATL
jgi:amino acid adenylation domain-containing protein